MTAQHAGCTTSTARVRALGRRRRTSVSRPVDERVERGRALGEPVGEHRRGFGELEGHPDPLRALAGEDEHESCRRVAGDPAHGGVGQPGEQLGPIGADDDRPVLERRPRGGQGHRDIGDVALHCGQQLGLPLQRVSGAPGQQPRHRGRRLALRSSRGFRGLFEDQVRVRPAHPERRDPGSARAVGGPRPALGEQADVARVPLDVRGRNFRVQRLRQHAVPDAPGPS